MDTSTTETTPSSAAPIAGVDVTEGSGAVLPTINASIQTLSYKAQEMKALSEYIPLNEYGLPEYIYRGDMIPNLTEMSQAERTAHLDAAIIALDYSQGFPTLLNGEPFWGQLPYEPTLAYKAFIAYLDLPRSPNQRLGTNDGSEHPLGVGNANKVPVRQLHLLKNVLATTTATLMSYCYTFYWPQRVRAYDLFTVALHSKRKEQRLNELEDDHYTMASKFMGYAETVLESILTDPDSEGLSPKEAIDLLMKMVQVQRMSVGASPMGATNGKHEGALPQNANLAVIMRTLVENSGVATKKDSGVDTTKLLLMDPEVLEVAQDLIIQMGDLGNAGRGDAPRSLNNNGDAFDDS